MQHVLLQWLMDIQCTSKSGQESAALLDMSIPLPAVDATILPLAEWLQVDQPVDQRGSLPFPRAGSPRRPLARRSAPGHDCMLEASAAEAAEQQHVTCNLNYELDQQEADLACEREAEASLDHANCSRHQNQDRPSQDRQLEHETRERH